MFLSPTEKVTRGAKLLDTKVPGWADRIDLSDLDIRHDETCMVGQLFGSYSADVVKLDIMPRSDEAIESGFFVPGSHKSSKVRAAYRELTDAWTDHIASRMLEAA